MPFEVVLAILVIFVAFPAVIFRGVANVRKANASGKGGGLRASELREIVRDAVEEATAPLHDRIDTLEGLLMGEDPSIAGRIDPELLALDADEEDAEEASPARRRSRS